MAVAQLPSLYVQSTTKISIQSSQTFNQSPFAAMPSTSSAFQQCIEYCSNAKKKQCPVCKQAFLEANVSRLYFQSVGNLYQKLINCEDNPGELRREIEKLEGEVSGT